MLQFPHALAIATLAFSVININSEANAGNKAEWQLVSDKDGFKTERKRTPGDPIFSFRGEIVTDVPIAKILTVFLDSSSRKYWVNRYHSSEPLPVSDQKGELERTYWIRFKTPWPISDRDYVLHAKGKINEKDKVFTTEINSTLHPDKPEDSCCVRGHAERTYYEFTAVPGTNKTKMVVEVHTNPKGILPNWLINLIQKNWPRKTLTALIETAKQPNVTVPPQYSNYKSWNN